MRNIELAVRAAFSPGDWVVGIGPHRGCSEVFEGDGLYQPFSYLNDYDPSHFRLASNDEEQAARSTVPIDRW